jgi:Zn finger protein HypA/HybF involved in hydrogenase expression
MKTIVLMMLTCLRCGHKWHPRGLKIIVCPKCKSPYWDVKPTEEKKDNGK